jgi:ectoine hydroxylase-related dioxygenase (phytanoyl-CoA dioxygenase family)
MRALDEQGYVVLESILSPDRLDALRRQFEQAANDLDSAPPSDGKQTGTRHVNGLLTQSVFRQVGLDPKLLASVFHVLKRRFLLTDIHGRDPLPGFGQQGLHADWHSPPIGKSFAVVTALCLLDDFTADNGATRVVPGTHRFTAPLRQVDYGPAIRTPAANRRRGQGGFGVGIQRTFMALRHAQSQRPTKAHAANWPPRV